MPNKSSVNLYAVHEDLGKYFARILKIHSALLEQLEHKVLSGEMELEEYLQVKKPIELPPAVLTSIATFLKQNEVMVKPDVLEGELIEYENQLTTLTRSIDFKQLGYEEED